MEEKKIVRQNIRSEQQVHNIILENRRKLSVSGVDEVESFNEEEIVLCTSNHGVMFIRGEGLHINKLNVDTGDVNIEGYVRALDYADELRKNKGSGLFTKLFR